MLCCLELGGCIQQYSSFRVNQHYPDQLTGLTCLLWERGRGLRGRAIWRQTQVTESHGTASVEVRYFPWATTLRWFVSVYSNKSVCRTFTQHGHIMCDLCENLYSCKHKYLDSRIPNLPSLFEQTLFSWHITEADESLVYSRNEADKFECSRWHLTQFVNRCSVFRYNQIRHYKMNTWVNKSNIYIII